MKTKPKKLNNKLSKEKGFILWLTGLSGAGKSTIADRLSQILHKKHVQIQRLDGNLTKGCFGNKLNLNKKDEHDLSVMTAAFVGSILEKHGILVIASFVSPYKYQREYVRNISMRFIEVYVKASIDTCIKRDVKGFYKKAISREIEFFPGYTDSYEIPENPNLIIDTDKMDIESSVKKIIVYLSKEKYI